MRRVPADTWVALVLLGACGFLLHDLSGTEGSGAFVKTTTLPTALVIALALLSLVLLAGSLLRRRRQPAAPADGERPMIGRMRVAAMVLWTAAFVAALPWFGYLASSATFLVGGALLYGNRRPITIVAIAVLVPLALLLFFEKYMIVLLPDARLFG